MLNRYVKIEGQKCYNMLNTDIIAAIGTKYNADILRASGQPQSAQELTEKLDIPIATCYRRIEQLIEANLLTLHDCVLSDQHRQTNIYQRHIDEITIQFRKDGIEMNLSRPSAVISQLNRVRESNSKEEF